MFLLSLEDVMFTKLETNRFLIQAWDTKYYIQNHVIMFLSKVSYHYFI